VPRAEAQRRKGRRIDFVVLAILCCSLLVAPICRAEESGGLDWSAWQRMPVLEDGRIMPLDTFARAQVKRICGDVAPRIGRLGTLAPEKRRSFSAEELAEWIKENQPRRFLAAELLYEWTVDPKKWADVPFLYAADADLRSEVLEVPLVGEDGRPLMYVSPRQARESTKLKEVAMDAEKRVMEAEAKRQSAKLTAAQKSSLELAVALGLFEKLSCDPARDCGRSWLDANDRPWVESEIAELTSSWNKFTDAYPKVFEQDAELLADVKKTDAAVRKLAEAYRPMQTIPQPTADGDAALGELRRVATVLAKRVDTMAKRELPEDVGLDKNTLQDLTGYRQIVDRWADHFTVQAAKARWSLYDCGGVGLFVVPALEPTAIEADRHRSEIYPWISLYALLEGSPDLLQGYSPEHVEQVRAAWADARDAYLDYDAADRGQKFAEAMPKFSARVRALSTEVEPLRAELPIIERDKGLLAKTAYPRAIAIDAEVFYNEFQPFFWACYVSLSAAAVFGLSFLVFRKLLFWLGTGTLIGSVLLLGGGLAVRVFITHWAPVTSMFETIVWVSMWVALLTLWINFLPLLGPASKTAWAWTAIPGSWEDKRRPNGDSDSHSNGAEVPARAVALTLRLLLFAVGLYVVGVIPALDNLIRHGGASYGSDYGVVSFLPRVDIGSTLPGVSSTLVWLASIFVSAVVVWYAPRLVTAGLLAIGLSVASVRREEAPDTMGSGKMEKIYSWRGIVLLGAVASFLAGLAANYAPFPREIEALMPVLRSNFWLGIHVLMEVTSYACFAAAWVIGNLALSFYLFGRYRTVQPRQRSNSIAAPGAMEDGADGDTEAVTVVEISQGERRPPAFCGTLANLNYRVMQVAVLMITTGTILGGLWADVSWGRFWGWDSKEVGALTALLVLLTALHGRRAGWPGDLTLAIGSVAGFFGVLWAWYVVNWLLPAGMHSYGAGEGGTWLWLVIVVGVQTLFALAAAVRARMETGRGGE
jgi:ABC-type transport system involved in cytochrome c biogenesis permease subunit